MTHSVAQYNPITGDMVYNGRLVACGASRDDAEDVAFLWMESENNFGPIDWGDEVDQ